MCKVRNKSFGSINIVDFLLGKLSVEGEVPRLNSVGGKVMNPEIGQCTIPLWDFKEVLQFMVPFV
jgi:hypothetical protein